MQVEVQVKYFKRRTLSFQGAEILSIEEGDTNSSFEEDDNDIEDINPSSNKSSCLNSRLCQCVIVNLVIIGFGALFFLGVGLIALYL